MLSRGIIAISYQNKTEYAKFAFFQADGLTTY